MPTNCEAEHTKNMIFVLVNVDNREWNLVKNSNDDPDIVVIDAKTRKPASKI